MRTILIADVKTPLDRVETALRAGIGAVQLRDKQASAKELFERAEALRRLTPRLWINERVDIALAVEAEGVHFPEGTAYPVPLRRGASVHSLEGALRAERQGAEYLFFGPVFESPSKPAAPQGIDKLRAVARALSIPVYAVGGVLPGRVRSLLEAGAFGVAGISAFLVEPEAIVRATRNLGGVMAIVSESRTAAASLEQGADYIQFRHKGSYTEEVLEEAKRVRLLSAEAGVPFIVNDRPDIALFLEADGVHLGQTDLPVRAARRILGHRRLIGATVGSLGEALAREQEGADYLGIGHIFPTQSKHKETPPLGLATLRSIAGRVSLPLFGIGGIDETNAGDVISAGASGVAVLSASIKTGEIKQCIVAKCAFPKWGQAARSGCRQARSPLSASEGSAARLFPILPAPESAQSP